MIGDSEALVARKASGVTTIADLAGRKVAAPFGSTAHYSLLAALQQSGVDPGAVTLVDLEPQNIQAAWQRGDIDAAYVWTPVLSVVQQDGVTLTDSAKLADRLRDTAEFLHGQHKIESVPAVETFRAALRIPGAVDGK
ncbi:MAG: glycine betaine ABC transporter substrate-binding protein [Umezawaea sp.]